MNDLGRRPLHEPTTTPPRDRAAVVLVLLQAACLLGALAFIVHFAQLALTRAPYPFELEWMEGGMVGHVARLSAGEPLYVAPSLRFVPFIYNPFYYVAALPFAAVFGTSLLALRVVSIVATFACFALIHRIVFRETGRHLPALVAAGLYAATYPLSGAWFDLARVDSLCMALCLAAIACARSSDEPKVRAMLGAAAFSWLAFLTKQTSALLMPALALYFVWALGLRRAALHYALPAGFATLASIAVLQLSSDGWYWFYAFEVAADHDSVPALYKSFWTWEMLPPLRVAWLFAAYALWRLQGSRPGARAFYFASGLPLIAMSYASRVHSGSFVNDNMPAHMWVALMFGLGVHALLTDSARGDRRVQAFVLGAVLLQLGSLHYDAAHILPSRADVAEGKRVVEAIAKMEGEVLVPFHPELAARAGKSFWAHEMAMVDVDRVRSNTRGKIHLQADIRARLGQKHFSAIILDNHSVVSPFLAPSYTPARAHFVKHRGALLPRSGARVRPLELFVPSNVRASRTKSARK